MTEHTTGPVTSTAGTLGGDGPLRIAPGPGGEPAFDEHRPPVGRAGRRLRALRLLPADLPDLRAVGRGDGLPARAHLPDERGAAGRADDRRDGAALRRVPGLHGLRHRLPLRRAVRQADRGHARPGRAPLRPARGRPGPARCDLRALPLPAPAARWCAGRCGSTRRTGLSRRLRKQRCCCSGSRRRSPRWRRSRRRWAGPGRCRQRTPAQGRRRGTVGDAARAACSACSSPASTRPPRGCSRPRAATWSPRASQGCCGALSAHSGREAEAQAVRPAADRRASSRAGVDFVVVNAAGLRLVDEGVRRAAGRRPGVRASGRARFAARVRDVSELLAELGPVAPRHPLPVTVAYHDACHLGHAQGIRSQPRELLRGIPGLELREIADAELCCGSAGIYNLLEPEAGARARRPQGRHRARAPAPQLLVTANPGCLMQVASSIERRAARSALAHTVEVLDASIRGPRGRPPRRPARRGPPGA